MASFCILYYPYSRTIMDLREVSESIHQELQSVWAGREGRRSFFKPKCAFRGPRYTLDVKGGVKVGLIGRLNLCQPLYDYFVHT